MRCRIPNTNNRSEDRLMTIHNWLKRENDHHWLMVIDNADDPNIFSIYDIADNPTAAVNLLRYIPDCEHGGVFFTTRDLKAGRALAKGNPPIRVERLSTGESIEMLRHELEDINIERRSTNGEISQLATDLGHLPLAMVQATSFIKENSMTIVDYMNLLRDDYLATKTLKHNFEEDEPGRDPALPNAVYASWKLSLEQIQKLNPKAADLLYVVAFMDQSKIPGWILKTFVGGSPIDFARAVGLLLRFSLIGSGADDSYNMHRLMQLTVKQWLVLLGSEQHYQG